MAASEESATSESSKPETDTNDTFKEFYSEVRKERHTQFPTHSYIPE